MAFNEIRDLINKIADLQNEELLDLCRKAQQVINDEPGHPNHAQIDTCQQDIYDLLNSHYPAISAKAEEIRVLIEI